MSIMTKEKAKYWKMSQSETFAVLCALWVLPSHLKLRISLGNQLCLHLGLLVRLWLVRVKDKPLLGGEIV